MIQACTNLTHISLPKPFRLVVCTRGIFKGYVTTVQFLLEHGFGEPYHNLKHKVDAELSADVEESEDEGMWVDGPQSSPLCQSHAHIHRHSVASAYHLATTLSHPH